MICLNLLRNNYPDHWMGNDKESENFKIVVES